MKSRDLMPHSEGFFNNPYPEPINPVPRIDSYVFKIQILSSHLRLGHPKGLFPAGLPIKMLKVLFPTTDLLILIF